jgi:hypothetical protein
MMEKVKIVATLLLSKKNFRSTFVFCLETIFPHENSPKSALTGQIQKSAPEERVTIVVSAYSVKIRSM